MKFEYIDRNSLGSFSLDMEINVLDNLLKDKPYQEKKSLFFKGRSRRFYTEDFIFFDLFDNEIIEAIEIVDKHEFMFGGKDLFKLRKNDIHKLLKGKDEKIKTEEDGYMSDFLGLFISFENGKNTPSSVILFQKDYFNRKKDYDPIQEKKTESIDDLYDLLDL